MITAGGTAGALSPQLAEFAAALREAGQRAESLWASRDTEQLLQRPEPARWSAAEHIAHLSLTSRAYLGVLDRAFEEAEERRLYASGQIRMDLVGRMLAWLMEPPHRFRYRTRPAFAPVDLGPADEVLPTFLSLQDELRATLERANGLALDRIKIVSPFDQRVRYNAVSAYAVLLAHQRRHLWQAERASAAVNRAGGSAE